MDHKQRLLIISNNVLSTTRNNGKTLLSYFEMLPKAFVYQLYFSSEKPAIPGYHYFQLADRDILKGMFSPGKRGRRIDEIESNAIDSSLENKNVPKNQFSRLLREALWLSHWKSEELDNWLREVDPSAVFFLGGDCAFAYDICHYVHKKFKKRLCLYVTDDFYIPYKEDGLIFGLRKWILRRKLKRCLNEADEFFTVSEIMRREYLDVFGRDSSVIVNMPDSLKMEVESEEDDKNYLVYTGNLYYGRAAVIERIVEALTLYNQSDPKKQAILKIYTNDKPDEEFCTKLEKNGAGKYCGTLDKEGLKLELNRADILVFVESFAKEQIRKTRFSLSTKVPEYLSVGKPILAVGPSGIGSMEALKDCAVCVNDLSILQKTLHRTLNDIEYRTRFGEISLTEFEKGYSKEKSQSDLIKKIFL